MRIPRHYSLMTRGFSGITSNPIYVGDATTIAASLTTVAASVVTIQGTTDNLFTTSAASAAWSTMTVLTANGIYAIQPGAAWIRGVEAASTSSATLTIHKQIGD